MLDLGQQMADKGFWSQNEVRAIKAWIRDLKHIGYQPPSIIDKQMSMKVLNTYPADKTAVCLTGQMDRISIAWPPTQKTLLESVFGNDTNNYDLFYYVSTFNSKKDADENFLKTHLQPAYGILYHDPPLNPNVSTNNFDLRAATLFGVPPLPQELSVIFRDIAS
uniref:Uncharacterized protein n=1 Tax=Acrobeloides nanus TaxID=290746 RepID=A0A914DY11_9BILA